jgi:hypothetical protein
MGIARDTVADVTNTFSDEAGADVTNAISDGAYIAYIASAISDGTVADVTDAISNIAVTDVTDAIPDDANVTDSTNATSDDAYIAYTANAVSDGTVANNCPPKRTKITKIPPPVSKRTHKGDQFSHAPFLVFSSAPREKEHGRNEAPVSSKMPPGASPGTPRATPGSQIDSQSGPN